MKIIIIPVTQLQKMQRTRNTFHARTRVVKNGKTYSRKKGWGNE